MNAHNEPADALDACKALVVDLVKLVAEWEERQRSRAAIGTMIHTQYAGELRAVLQRHGKGQR